MIYELVLCLHIIIFTAAFFLGGIGTFGLHRLRASATREQALEVLATLQPLGKMFPAAVILLLLTGAALAHWRWSFGDGWVIVGIIGVIALGVNGGAFMGARERALHGFLKAHPAGALNQTARAALPDRAWFAAEAANMAIAAGVIFVMVLKTPLIASLAIVIGLAIAGAALAVSALDRGERKVSFRESTSPEALR